MDNPLLLSMEAAIAAGNEKPQIRYKGYRLTLAKPNSANPRHVYVKDSNYQYLGKISPQGNMLGKDLQETERTTLEPVIWHPEEALMTEGKETGQCCACGRTLTNPLSIELGIGPICRGYLFGDSGRELPDIEQLEADFSGELADTTSNVPLLDQVMGNPLDTLESLSSIKPVNNLQVALEAYNLLTKSEKIEFIQAILIKEIIS